MKTLFTLTFCMMLFSIQATIPKLGLNIGFQKKKPMLLKIELKPQKPILFSMAPKPPKRDSKNYHDSPLLGFRSQLDERIWWTQVGLNSISGMARGVKDKCAFNYPALKQRFPGMNDSRCDANQSYLRKWKNNDPEQGERFWGSSRWFVPFVDLWHGAQFVNHSTMYFSMILPLYPSYDRRLNWKEFAGRYATIIGANVLGYHFAYDKLFRL